MGREDDAKRELFKAADMANEFGDVRTRLMCLSNLLAYFNNKGDFETSENLFKEVLPLAESVGDLRIYSFVLYSGATLENHMGRREKALLYAEKARALSEEIGSKEQEAHCLALIGEVSADLQDYEGARESGEKALSIYREMKLSTPAEMVEGLLGFLSVATNGKREGLERIEKILDGFEKSENWSDFFWASIYFVKASFLLGDVEKAREVCEMVAERSREQGYSHIMKKALSLKILLFEEE